MTIGYLSPQPEFAVALDEHYQMSGGCSRFGERILRLLLPVVDRMLCRRPASTGGKSVELGQSRVQQQTPLGRGDVLRLITKLHFIP